MAMHGLGRLVKVNSKQNGASFPLLDGQGSPAQQYILRLGLGLAAGTRLGVLPVGDAGVSAAWAGNGISLG